MKKLSIALLSVLFLTSSLIIPNLKAQNPPVYTEGSVWNLTFVKLKANMGDDYLKGLAAKPGKHPWMSWLSKN